MTKHKRNKLLSDVGLKVGLSPHSEALPLHTDSCYQ